MLTIPNEWFREQLISRIQRTTKIALPDTFDVRSWDAAEYVLHHHLPFEIVFIGSSKEITDFAHHHQRISILQSVTIVDPATLATFEELSEWFYHRRQHKGLSREQASILLRNSPLHLAGALLAHHYVDAVVAGSLSTTADVIRAALQTVGLSATSSLVSSFFLMLFSHHQRVWAYADCGVVPDPSSEELATIAVDTAMNYQRITGQTPRVAFLSFSTKGSAEHPSIDKIREALQLAQQREPALLCDGELQFDAAIDTDVARRKAPSSLVAGQANVFIFPNLDAGNIAYKITERLGGAQAIGPNLQGLAQPYLDLSRGCTAADIVISLHLAALMADE